MKLYFHLSWVVKNQKLRPFSTYLMTFEKEDEAQYCFQGKLPTSQAWPLFLSLFFEHFVLEYRLIYCASGFHVCFGRQQPCGETRDHFILHPGNCFLTALLILYNLHFTKLIPLKCTFQCFLVYLQNCVTITIM